MPHRLGPGLLAGLLVTGVAFAQELPLFDAHLHYSDTAQQAHTADEALALMDRAGVRRALLSSTPNEGTVTLFEKAPGRIVPFLRPYRTRDDIATWTQDAAIVRYVEQELGRGIYRGIGEFHLRAGEAASPVVRQIVTLAERKNLILHAHADAQAVEELLRLAARVRILWAHAGLSAGPKAARGLLESFPALFVELALRSDIAPGGQLDPEWQALFLRHPDRFLVGTDT